MILNDKNLQTANVADDTVACLVCSNNLVELGHHTYTGKSTNTPTQKDEICKCKSCGIEFLLHYDFFDDQGHVNSFVFDGDINDASYNWQDQLTPEQKEKIGEHLKGCKICSDRLEHEIISDAWLASLIHNK